MQYLSRQRLLLPGVYGTIALPLWLELRNWTACQATPTWTVYQPACHWLLPWLQVMFAMVPDATRPGSGQRRCGTAPVAGPVGQLGRHGASNPWGVVCCYLALSPPRCACLCGVHGPVALVGKRRHDGRWA